MIDAKQSSQSLLDAVVRFFELYPDKARIEKNLVMGTADITLSGDLARIFRDQTVTHPEREDFRVLKLLLNSNTAQVARGYQTVAPRSRLVTMIENRLQTEAIRFSRSVAVVNTSYSYSDLRSLGVTIRHTLPNVECEQKMRQFFVATYLFKQSAYECQEDYIPVVMDASTGAVIEPSLAGQFASLKSLDSEDVKNENTRGMLLPSPPENVIEPLLARAEEEARHRALAVAVRMHESKNEEYQAELQREKLAYEADKNDTKSPARRSELKELYDEKVQKLGERYKVHSELTLTSLQEVQVPQITYEILAEIEEQRITLGHHFVYDPLGNWLSSDLCDNCGHGAEHREWNFCRRGVHLECASCNTIRCCSSPNCKNTACEVHSVSCAFCEDEVCAEHESKCEYCTTEKVYCGTCMEQSWESRDICFDCRGQCHQCDLYFPKDGGYLETCCLCNHTFCQGHVKVCPGCQLPVCQADRGPVEGHEEEYCNLCRDICVECPSEKSYAKQDLVLCKSGDEPLCSVHDTRCSNCDDPLCPEHRLETVMGIGCAECFHVCHSCQGLPVLLTSLADCVRCPPESGLMYCKEQAHVQECAVCRGNVCESHRLILETGQWACIECSKQCGTCGDHFAPELTFACTECGSDTCHKDVVKSEFDNAPFCPTHAQSFISCQGCGFCGPPAQAQVCDLCGHGYGPCCISGSRCKYCLNMAPIETDQAAVMIPAGEHHWARKPHAYAWEIAQNKTSTILRATYTGGMFGFITKRFVPAKYHVVVCSKNSSTYAARAF